MPSVNWVVPLRRAVVRGECSYVELLGAWAAALRESGAREALARWYPAAGEGRSLRGSTWVDAVIAHTRAELSIAQQRVTVQIVDGAHSSFLNEK